MRCCILFTILLPIFMTGCESPMTLEEKSLRVHVVDACFTVQEQQPADAQERIDTYLRGYQERGELSEREVFTLKTSLKRAKEKR